MPILFNSESSVKRILSFYISFFLFIGKKECLLFISNDFKDDIYLTDCTKYF